MTNETNAKKFVAVAGNIGVGKSTLVKMLCERLKWEPFFEPQAQNPYLADFYQNMRMWSFHSQIFFLSHRLRMHLLLVEHPTSVIQDRTVYEDAEIFAQNLYKQGEMSKRDYDTYRDLYRLMKNFLPPPDLVVYLRASENTLHQRIARRGRTFEREISRDYLHRLNVLYENWVEAFNLCPVLTVPADDLDYVANPGHLDLIVEKIREKLTGKEEVVFYPDEVANGIRRESGK